MRSIGGPAAVRDMVDAQGTGLDPLLRRRARAPVADRGADLEPELFDRRWLLQGAQRAAADACAGRRSNAISPILMTAPRRMRSRWRWRGSKRGELLSPASTARLLSTMASTRTGKARVRAALAPGLEMVAQDRHRAGIPGPDRRDQRHRHPHRARRHGLCDGDHDRPQQDRRRGAGVDAVGDARGHRGACRE